MASGNRVRKLRIIIDIGMSILLFVAMSYQFTEQRNHEIAGAGMFFVFILHHMINYKWYLSLAKGKYSPSRILLVVVDFVILADMLVLMLSGIRMSRYVFDFIHLHFSMQWARSAHMVASYGGFLLMGLHIGLHYGMILGMIRKAFHIAENHEIRAWIARSVAGLISIYGIYALLKRDFLSYITLKMHFVFFDYTEPVLYYVLDLIAIMALMIFVGYYLQKALIYLQKNLLLKSGR